MKRKLLAAMLLSAATASPAFAQYTLTILASFNGTDGNEPIGGLVLSGGTLYGTTFSGGGNGVGEVFSLPTTGGTPTVLGSFNDNGTNGASPEAGLILSGSTLYGTTNVGGITGDKGTVFSVPVTGGTPTVLASFNGSNGAGPQAGLVLSGSTLYGTTNEGGATFSSGDPGDGEVFSVPTSGGTPTVLASFNGANGFRPTAGVILSGSTLYGTTTSGGATFQNSSTPGDGEVFSLPTSGGAPTVLTSFNGANGNDPVGGVILSGSTLYGTTNSLAGSAGEVFSLPIAGGDPTVLAPFNVNGTEGIGPDASLLLSDGTLYGTAIGSGGANALGTVFSVPAIGGTPTVLASFDGTNGSHPEATLIMDANGNLYGTTADGGTDAAFNDGTVFELSPISMPEPTSASLFAIGSLAFLRRRRARHSIVC